MAIGQGTIYTASDVKAQLREANRTSSGNNYWNKLYNAIDLQEQSGNMMLSTELGTALNQAYLSSLSREQSILGSTMGQGFKSAALDENESNLNEAFHAYRQNYINGLNSLNESMNEARAEIDSLLNDYSTKLSEYGNAHFEYLNWLYRKNSDAFSIDNQSKINPLDLGLSLYINNDGVPRTLEELTALAFDESGELTREGASLFKAIENNYYNPGESFGDYLSETNQELFDWAIAVDPYNSESLSTGSETFKQLVAEGDYKTDDSPFKEFVFDESDFANTTTGVKDLNTVTLYVTKKQKELEDTFAYNSDLLKEYFRSGKINVQQYSKIYKSFRKDYLKKMSLLQSKLADFSASAPENKIWSNSAKPG